MPLAAKKSHAQMPVVDSVVKSKYRDGNIYMLNHPHSEYLNDACNNSYADWYAGSPAHLFNKYGPAVDLSASEKIRINSSKDPTSPSGFTIIARVKANSFSSSDPRLWIRGSNTVAGTYGARFDFNYVSASAGNARFRIQDSSTTYTAEITSSALSANNYAVVIGRYDGKTVQAWLLVDGSGPITASSSHTGSIDQNTGWSTLVGGDIPAGPATEFDGEISWLMTWPRAIPISELYQIARTPWMIFQSKTIPYFSSAGTTYYQTNTGSVTPVGVLSKSVMIAANVAGAITPAGAISKKTFRALSGSSTPSGAVTKKTLRALAGSITLIGSVYKATKRALVGSTTPSGDTTTAYTTTQSTSGSTTPSGAVSGMIVILTPTVQKIRRLYYKYLGRR